MKRFSILTFALAVFAMMAILPACDKDKDDGPSKEPEPDVASGEFTLKNDADTVWSVNYISGFKNVRFTCTDKWQVVIPEDSQWIKADVVSGDATAEMQRVRFDYVANPDTQERTGHFQLVSGNSVKYFRVVQAAAPRSLTLEEVAAMGIDVKKVYTPNTGSIETLLNTGNEFSFARSRVSPKGNVLLFWDKAYGDYEPNAEEVDKGIRVDVNDFLKKADLYFDYYVNDLKMVEYDKSMLKDYYMAIFLYGTTSWRAEGGGNNKMGSAWFSATTCQPTGSTIAHELGHSFQFQAVGDGAQNSGGAHWEDFANWMSYSQYAEQAFNSGNFTVFSNYYQNHFHSTSHMYASYWFQYQWTDKHGKEAFGNVWRGTKAGEEVARAYMRIYCNDDINIFNADLYEYAAKCATWDFTTEVITYNENEPTVKSRGMVKDYGKDYIGKLGWKSTTTADGYYAVSTEMAPEATGFNVIRLNLPESDNNIKVKFVGMPKAQGYSTSGTNADNAGWTSGFVALLSDGTRQYSDPVTVGKELEGEISWTVPANTEKLWYIVACTPNKYYASGTGSWPFKIQIQNTDIYGTIKFTGDEQASDVEIVKQVECSASAGYAGPVVNLEADDLRAIGTAFVMQPYDIAGKMAENRDKVASGAIKFGAVEPDGSVSYNFTADGWGHWFAADGSVSAWSAAYLYSQFTPGSWSFQFGVHPNRVSGGEMKAGDKYTVRQALVYGEHKAVIRFEVTIVE